MNGRGGGAEACDFLGQGCENRPGGRRRKRGTRRLSSEVDDGESSSVLCPQPAGNF